MEWRSVRETGTDELDKQLTVEENHDCSSLHETLLQNKLLMIALCSLLLNVVEESNRNVVAVVEINNRHVVVVEENNGNVVVSREKKL